MLQQINLFKQVKTAEAKGLNTAAFLISLGVLTALLALTYALEAWQMKHIKNHTDKVLAELTITKQTLANTMLQFPHSKYSDDVIKLPPCDIRFSRYLQAYARALVPGVWLTQFDILGGGEVTNLIGQATDAPAVQLYIEQLKQQPLFTNFTFELADITAITQPGDKTNDTEILTFHIIGKG